MDNIGAEVGQKMRSAIKAKLMELDCYVDDELPDYIMVMVANKRTKSQMNEDLNLFLSTKTSAFVNWLHIVLKKLKEVTVTNPDIYKKVSKRKSDEHEDVKTKKEKRDKKVKKEDTQGFPDEKPIIKLDVEANFSADQQEEKSLTDDLPVIKKPLLTGNRKVIITSNVEISSTQTVYEDNFDIPLLSDVQDCNEEDLDAIEKKIRSVKSRLGLLVESDEENQNVPLDITLETTNQEAISQKETTSEEPNENEETVKENETNTLANSRQITILQNEITESQNKELEKLTFALEKEENLQEEEPESYTPKRKESRDDFYKTNKDNTNENQSKHWERKHERITFNPDDLSPKRPSVRERLGRKSSTSPERPERDRRRNSFYAGCEDEKFKRNEVHRDFKEWVALRQADDTRDRPERGRERRDRSWNRRGRSRERRDRSWERRDNASWNRKDKSRDRYEKLWQDRNRSRSPNRPNRSLSREGRNKSGETVNSHSMREQKDLSRERKERVRERSRSRPKDAKPEGVLSKIVMSKISVPQKPADSEKSEDEQVVREVPSLVKVKRTIRTGKAQPNKNLLLRAVAEAQRSVAQAPKSGTLSSKKPKSIQDRLGVPGAGPALKSRKLDQKEKNKLKSLLEQSRKNRILRRMMDREGINSSEEEYIPKPLKENQKDTYDSSEGEYIPEPVRKVAKEVPKYVPSTKASQEDSDGDSSDKSRSPKRQFIITLDGVERIKKDLDLPEDEEEKHGKSEEKTPPKIRSDGRRVPSPIVFNKKEFSTQSAVKSSVPNIPDKLPVVHPPLSVKNKERCKYWPGCRQGDKCEFVHPTQTCEMFPQCKFGDKCLYLHPKCKFGSSCTKKECPYDHNVVKSLSASKILATIQNCKFYPNCTNLNCPFFHPKPCKYGKFCTNPNECPFLHTFAVKRSLSWKSK